MAHPSNQRLSGAGLVRLVLIFVGLFLVAFVLRPSFFGRSSKPKRKSTTLVSCPRCSCNCPSDSFFLSSDIFNMSSSGCASEDPEMNEEMKKDIIALLSEEISLQKNVTRDSLEHTQALTMDTKRISSHYQKEAHKCYAMVDTCEDAREKAEAALVEERKFTVLWEERARGLGWNDEKRLLEKMESNEISCLITRGFLTAKTAHGKLAGSGIDLSIVDDGHKCEGCSTCLRVGSDNTMHRQHHGDNN